MTEPKPMFTLFTLITPIRAIRARRAAALLGAAVALALAPSARAGRFDPDVVPADARWMAHVDLEAFADSTLGEALLEMHEAHGDMDDVDDFFAYLGLECEDIHSITAWGGDRIDGEGVVVAETSIRAERAVERLAAHEDLEHAVTDVNGASVDVFIDGGDRFYLHLRRAKGEGRRLVVLSEERDGIALALDVLDGRHERLSPRSPLLLGVTPRDGAFLFMAAHDVKHLEELNDAHEIARLTDRIVIEAGESDGEAYARAVVTAETEQQARDIAAVVQGVVALGRLVAAEEPDLEPLRTLADAVRVRTRDSRIEFALAMDAERLVDLLRSADAGEELFDDWEWSWDDDDDDDDDDHDDD